MYSMQSLLIPFGVLSIRGVLLTIEPPASGAEHEGPEVRVGYHAAPVRDVRLLAL